MQQHQAALQSAAPHSMTSPPVFLPSPPSMMPSQQPSDSTAPLNLTKPKQASGHGARFDIMVS